MADTAINAAPIRFEGAGIFRIIDGATSYVPAYYFEGSLSVTPGMQDKIQVNDRETLPAPLLGKKNTTRLKAKFRMGQHDSTGLQALLSNQVKASPDAYVKEFTVQIDIPNYIGASAGKRLPLTLCSVVPGSIQYQAGTEYDTIEFEMDSREAAPAWTTF